MVAGPLRTLAAESLLAPAEVAARRLLGTLLLREMDGIRVVARIVETEAYRQDDPASHCYRRRTQRNEPMFAAPGTAYVYRSYGVHWCLNVSVEPSGVGAAVLVRSATVMLGAEVVRRRRSQVGRDADLLRGPGCLTAGLDIDAVRFDGRSLLDSRAPLQLVEDGWEPPHDAVVAGPRVGVSAGAQRHWRFHLRGNDSVSAYRRSPQART
ncbi:MAG: DNA-3-methyladenine glycosylase [Nitriliruptor sp.]|nr:MAG: DNA-3-methyladenine glycosylase [Nitriliruptor sp.]